MIMVEKCVNYSVNPIPFEKGKFVYLYKTTNILNGDIYIGVRIYRGKDPFKDRYIGNGCGILKDGRLYKRRGKETNFRRALSKWGYLNFKKEIICFFSSLEDALQSEANIVDEEFLTRKDTLNMVIGGGFPPFGVGTNNSNFGKRWTDEMKAKLSKKRKRNGKSKGGNNPKAISCYVFDLFLDKCYQCEYLHQLSEIDKDVKRAGLNKIRKFRWLILKEDLNKEEIKDFVLKNFDEKYQKTFLILQEIKRNKSVEEIIDMGFYKAHVVRLKNSYDKSIKH